MLNILILREEMNNEEKVAREEMRNFVSEFSLNSRSKFLILRARVDIRNLLFHNST